MKNYRLEVATETKCLLIDLCLPLTQELIKANGWVVCDMAMVCVRVFPMVWPLSSVLHSVHLWPPCALSRAMVQCSRTSPPRQTLQRAAAVASSSTSTRTAKLSPARRRACSAAARSLAACDSCASLTLGPQSPASAALREVTPP